MRYNYKDPDEWFNAGEKIAISGYAPRTYTVTPGQDKAPARKGALVEWYNEGKHLIKRNNTFTVVDVETGGQFKAVMIGGYNHADIEPATRRYRDNEGTVRRMEMVAQGGGGLYQRDEYRGIPFRYAPRRGYCD